MSGQWKPGDVASVGGMHALYTDGNIGPEFHFADGSVCRAEIVPAVGPLVVIDPDDRKQVERLRNLWDDAHEDQQGHRPSLSAKGARGNALQAALREFANPTPPKPDEPQGLGAVVRDAEGYLYSRGYPEQADDFVHVWHVVDRAANLPRSWWKWDEIDAVEVLSEGVTR